MKYSIEYKEVRNDDNHYKCYAKIDCKVLYWTSHIDAARNHVEFLSEF